MNNEDKPIGITDAHPILKEGGFWFLIGAICVGCISFVVILTWALLVNR